MCQVIAKTTNTKSQKTHEISGLAAAIKPFVNVIGWVLIVAASIFL